MLDVQGNAEGGLRAGDLPAAAQLDRLPRPAVAIDVVAADPGVGRVALVDAGRRGVARLAQVAGIGFAAGAALDRQLGAAAHQVAGHAPGLGRRADPASRGNGEGSKLGAGSGSAIGPRTGRIRRDGRSAPRWRRLVASVGAGQVFGKSAFETERRRRWPGSNSQLVASSSIVSS